MQIEPQAENTAAGHAARWQTRASGELSDGKAGRMQVVRSGRRLVPLPRGSAGTVVAQTSAVRIHCFPSELETVLRTISSHFGAAVVVTSGYRSSGKRGSYHRRCMAADIQIAGVAPSTIARFARTLPQVGGIGTYRHTRSVHVDIGNRAFTWHGGRGRSASLRGHGCCPVCDAMAALPSGGVRPRFQATACPA